MSKRAKVVLFASLCVACIAAAVSYAALATGDTEDTAVARAPDRKAKSAAPTELATIAAGGHVVFRRTGTDAYGRIALAKLGAPAAAAVTTPLDCERVYFAGGRGLCLQADRGVFTKYHGVLFDEKFRKLKQFSLAGAPSRTRVSRDGKIAAYTVFVTGHSYAQAGFSTRTALVDASTGRELGQLERFLVRKNGKRFFAVDFNFWGVTFPPRGHDRFYATLGTGGKTYLVEGSIAKREMKVLREGVECPSLSPDGTKIAFKRRVGGGVGPVSWRISVLDVATLRDHPLPAETRNVDDQIEWLDDEHVLYGMPEKASGTAVTDVWSLRADGTGKPVRLLRGAWSPAVVSAE
jgi:WD40-like Beta Propeller Repeat